MIRTMIAEDGELEPGRITWVCHGCHARHDQAEECCPGEALLMHDITQPCEDCALPEILDE